MRANYFYLISSLPVFREDTKYSTDQLQSYFLSIFDQIEAEDAEELSQICHFHDNLNLSNYLAYKFLGIKTPRHKKLYRIAAAELHAIKSPGSELPHFMQWFYQENRSKMTQFKWPELTYSLAVFHLDYLKNSKCYFALNLVEYSFGIRQAILDYLNIQTTMLVETPFKLSVQQKPELQQELNFPGVTSLWEALEMTDLMGIDQCVGQMLENRAIEMSKLRLYQREQVFSILLSILNRYREAFINENNFSQELDLYLNQIIDSNQFKT